VIEGIFAVLYVSHMGLTHCYRTVVFSHIFSLHWLYSMISRKTPQTTILATIWSRLSLILISRWSNLGSIQTHGPFDRNTDGNVKRIESARHENVENKRHFSMHMTNKSVFTVRLWLLDKQWLINTEFSCVVILYFLHVSVAHQYFSHENSICCYLLAIAF